MKPQTIMIFTKRANLMEWYGSQPIERDKLPAEHYAKERDIQLIVQFAFEESGVWARIKCPINPLPVVGWFQTPTTKVLQRSLEAFGWKKQQTLNASFLL